MAKTDGGIMRVGWSAGVFALLALAVLSWLPGTASSMQCREPRLEEGSSGPAGDSKPDKCWCGILWTSHHRVCDSKVRIVPDRYLCDGPESEVKDCRYGHPRWIQEDTQKCTLLLFQAGVLLTDVRITLPVCVGTACIVTGSEIVGPLPNAMEIPCGGDSDGDDDPR